MKMFNENDFDYRFDDKSGPKYLMRGPNIDFGLVKFLPGESFPTHYHNHIEEDFYILEGELEFTINDEEVIDVKKGTLIHAAPGDTHYIENKTDEIALAIFVKAPFDPDDKVNV